MRLSLIVILPLDTRMFYAYTFCKRWRWPTAMRCIICHIISILKIYANIPLIFITLLPKTLYITWSVFHPMACPPVLLFINLMPGHHLFQRILCCKTMMKASFNHHHSSFHFGYYSFPSFFTYDNDSCNKRTYHTK